MKEFMQEYGRGILAALIGSISIGICYYYLTGTIFRVEENTTEQVVVSAADEPVIVAPDIIKVDVGDGTYNATAYMAQRESAEYQEVYQRYLGLVRAYEDSKGERLCSQVTVAGIEQVDVSRPGRYQVIYRAENENGHSFVKTVPVIVR